MVGKDGRLVARENEFRVLRALHRFGWLRTRDLAALCWKRWLPRPMATLSLAPIIPSESELRMAQRTLKRLRTKRCVISAQAPDGSILYTVSAAGCRVLKDAGIEAVSGKDLVRNYSSAFFRHRCISNEIAIAGITQGFRVSTEREISRALWFGGEAGVFGKRPDVVLRNSKQAIFCEVEKSRKNRVEYQALLRWLCQLLILQKRLGGRAQISDKVCLERVIFICTQGFKVKLQRDLVLAGWPLVEQDALIDYSCALYQFRDILFP